MKVLRTVGELHEYRFSHELTGKCVGFVPTMGALHEGHLSLTDYAGESCDIIIVSIFVNPTQFNDPRDLKNYPRDIERDLQLLSMKEIDAVFIPSAGEIYPEPDTRTFNFGMLDKVMEGKHRPGHFTGVAQVVSKLFDMVRPDKAFFGQKDYQQLLIIRELVRQMDIQTEIIACPIVREEDGLAMSSRNALMSPEERLHATFISKTLFRAREKKQELSPSELTGWVVSELNKDPFLTVEYFEIADASNLHPVSNWEGAGTIMGFVAVKLPGVRLIDNIIFD